MSYFHVRIPGIFRPYLYNVFLLGLIPLALWLDIHTQNVWQQDVLGILSLSVLVFCTRFSQPAERRQVWIMVAVATCVEIWSSVIWGIYRYRFYNMPLFIPWGHGLVYLFALRAARTPLMLRFGRQVSRAALTMSTGWMIFGVAIEPIVIGRLDLTGALFWPIFVWFMRKPSAPIYAAAFFITSYLELIGTHFGNWTWQVYAPMSHIPTGNPPSVIAAGYCIMDFMSLSLAARMGEARILDRILPSLCARRAPASGRVDRRDVGFWTGVRGRLPVIRWSGPSDALERQERLRFNRHGVAGHSDPRIGDTAIDQELNSA